MSPSHYYKNRSHPLSGRKLPLHRPLAQPNETNVSLNYPRLIDRFGFGGALRGRQQSLPHVGLDGGSQARGAQVLQRIRILQQVLSDETQA